MGEVVPHRREWAENPKYYHGQKPPYAIYYEPYKYYSFIIYNVNLWRPDTPETQSKKSIQLKIYNPNGKLVM